MEPVEMRLKAKYRNRPKSKGTKSGGAGNSGGKGKAARRAPGWRKHGKGPQNVSR